jgi:phosphate acetyltransferase
MPESGIALRASLIERVRRLPRKKRIVFPEGSDERVRKAAQRLATEGLVDPILIAGSTDAPVPGVKSVAPCGRGDYARIYYERRRARGVTEVEAGAIARNPLYYAALMVAAGDADGFVGGASNTTGETVRAALHCIGPRPEVRTVSSVFIVAVHDRSFGHKGLLALSDCALVVEPTAVELAEIALASAETVRALLGVDPIVALLSFSTHGSASHKNVDRVVEALRITRVRAPELKVDGELQADAALVPAVGASKAPGSTVAGKANTLIFPDLASANIAVKLVERLGEAITVGPILQGLAKPANDLSRGCSVDDVYSVALVTALQSGT